MSTIATGNMRRIVLLYSIRLVYEFTYEFILSSGPVTVYAVIVYFIETRFGYTAQ